MNPHAQRRTWRTFFLVTLITGTAAFLCARLLFEPSYWIREMFQFALPLALVISCWHRLEQPALRGSLYLIFSFLGALLVGIVYIIIIVSSLIGNRIILDLMFYLLALLAAMLQFFMASYLMPVKNFGRGLLMTLAAAVISCLVMQGLSGLLDKHLNILEGNESLDLVFDYGFYPIPIWQLLVGSVILWNMKPAEEKMQNESIMQNDSMQNAE